MSHMTKCKSSRYLPGHDIKVYVQYKNVFSFLKGSKVRFMDTMSLHMAISGLTGFQRTLWMANKLGKRRGLQEVKAHIKKAGQKRDGPMVCVPYSPYFGYSMHYWWQCASRVGMFWLAWQLLLSSAKLSVT